MGSSMDTITVDAIFVTSTDPVDANEQTCNVLLRTVINTTPAIKNTGEIK